MSEAITKATEDLAESLFSAWQTTPCSELDGDHILKWGDLGDHWKKAWITVAAAAISQPAPSPQPAVPVVSDERLLHEWYRVSHIAEVGSRRLAVARAILALRPQAVPMTNEVRRSYQCLIAMNTPHGFGDRIGPFVKWLQDSGITAKAEGGA